MECNKEEAIRAKEIAEKKMENHDFSGARKIALKAQQLFPGLENISQMIMVCDVHCATEKKLYGNERDWYDILKVEPTADEVSIKKQFRKFALFLHPDKNKFAGAVDAFKLIGEAQRVLLDPEKRTLYDNKCKALGRSTIPRKTSQPANSYSSVGRQPWVQDMSNKSQSTGLNHLHQQPQQQSQAHPGYFSNRPTFWTVCPFCSVRYQYFKDLVNKHLWCQGCKRYFTAYEINYQGAAAGGKKIQATVPQPKEVPSVNPSSELGSQGTGGSVDPTKGSFLTTRCSSEVQGSKSKKQCGNVDGKINDDGLHEEIRSNQNTTCKRRKKKSESSKSCDTESTTDIEEDIDVEKDGGHVTAPKFGCYGDQFPWRSTRLKQHVSYDKNLNNEEEARKSSKKPKCSGSFNDVDREAEDPLSKEENCNNNKTAGHSANVEGFEKQEGFSKEEGLQNDEKESTNANEGVAKTLHDEENMEADTFVPSGSSYDGTECETYECPDPDFSDFDKDRKEECFAAGQIWACYDTLDAMPRFYALIRKVLSPGFKLRITWLEPDPDDEDEIKWCEKDLPVSCGKYVLGSTENTEDHPMFSYLVCWEKGRQVNTYFIYPRKGETWAVFKNWDTMYAVCDNKKKYDFEFVEIVSDYSADVGVRVVYLGKLKGFVCLFCRTTEDGTNSNLIPPREMFRFSHRLPSFQMTGEESKDVPEGSLELDPACLPANLEEIVLPENLNTKAGKKHSNDSRCKALTNIEKPVPNPSENASKSQADQKTNLDSNFSYSNKVTENGGVGAASNQEAFEIPDPEFYNFDDDKSKEKFQVGQIWALYSDEDGMPKYYGLIKRIDTLPVFKLYLAWFSACFLPKDMIRWVEKKMPISCGSFKPQKRKLSSYTSTNSFSHQMKAERTNKKDVYTIFPKKGEVWALYKNWSAGMACSELENCQYDMVELMSDAENDESIRVRVLGLVSGFESVFKPQKKGQTDVTMQISRAEILRFSHHIPAFQLTEERGGSLKGFWELDPAALPVSLFSSG